MTINAMTTKAVTTNAMTTPSHGITVERWTRASRLALACVAIALALFAIAPLTFGAGTIDRLTALFIYVILAAMWNALAGYRRARVRRPAGVLRARRLFHHPARRCRAQPLPVDVCRSPDHRSDLAAALLVHAAAEGRRICHRHVGRLRADPHARQSRQADPGRNRDIADLAQRL